jgi:hypothetical protein
MSHVVLQGPPLKQGLPRLPDARFPDAAILVTGVEDPETRAHSPNEGLHLAEWERVCLAETLLLHHLAGRGGS